MDVPLVKHEYAGINVNIFIPTMYSLKLYIYSYKPYTSVWTFIMYKICFNPTLIHTFWIVLKITIIMDGPLMKLNNIEEINSLFTRRVANCGVSLLIALNFMAIKLHFLIYFIFRPRPRWRAKWKK